MIINARDLAVEKVVKLVLEMKDRFQPATLQYFFEHNWAMSIAKHNRDLEFSVFSLHNNPIYRHQSRMICLKTDASNEEIERVIRELVQPIIEANPKEYVYGMRLRGFSPMCQPKEGFVERRDDTTGKYHDIIVYDRKLTEEEIRDYELDRVG